MVTETEYKEALTELREFSVRTNFSVIPFLTFLIDKKKLNTPIETEELASFFKEYNLYNSKHDQFFNPWMRNPYKNIFSCSRTVDFVRRPPGYGCWYGKDTKINCSNFACKYFPTNNTSKSIPCDFKRNVIWRKEHPDEMKYSWGSNYISNIRNYLLKRNKIPLLPLLTVFYRNEQKITRITQEKFIQEFNITKEELTEFFYQNTEFTIPDTSFSEQKEDTEKKETESSTITNKLSKDTTPETDLIPAIQTTNTYAICSNETKKRDQNEIQNFLGTIDFKTLDRDFHSLKQPDMITVRDILKNTENNWQLPNFQRYFDWDKEKVRAFIESVFNDYYVGSFLLWEKKRNVESEVQLIKIDGVTKEIQDTLAIILDGQQRITALYWAIRGPNLGSKPKKVPETYFYIDFKAVLSLGSKFGRTSSEDIVTNSNINYDLEETYKKFLFPLYKLEDYRIWLKGFEDYLLKSQVLLGLDFDKIRFIREFIDDRLRHMWDGFKIPCVFLPESMKLRQVAEIFERINTKGKRLGIFDLLMARLLNYGIQLRTCWDVCERTHPNIKRYYNKYEKIPVHILQAISLYYDTAHSCKGEDILDIYSNVYQDSPFNFEDHWKIFSEYIDRAIKQIENPVSGYGVRDEKSVPFIPMLTMIAALFKHIDGVEDRASCYKKMDIWYWSSVFSNAYSSSADSTLSAHYKEMLDWFTNDDQTPSVVRKARREIDHLDLIRIKSNSSAMYRGVLSLLLLERAKDFAEKKEVGHARDYHRHHIFPKGSILSSNYPIDSILNMTWLTKATNQRITKAKKPSIYLNQLLSEKYSGREQDLLNVLHTHFIDRTSYELMLKDDDGFEQFLEHRQDLIKSKIMEKLGIPFTGIDNVLIKPGDPWGNKIAYEDAISSCNGVIRWYDRWFTIQGLTFLSHAVNQEKVKEIQILTAVYSRTDKSAVETMEELRETFKEFRNYMKKIGISCEIRILPSHLRSTGHDRWLFSDSYNYRLPSPDTVRRNQYSEISKTQVRLPFNEWWTQCKELIKDWNSVKEIAEKFDNDPNKVGTAKI